MTYIIASLALSLLASSSSIGGPPPPPEGYVWVRDGRFSDEFDGDKLDTNKWFDHHPYWEGRPPAKFMPYTVSVKDGMMQIKNGILNAPGGKFTIACGAVVSKSVEAHYGYYEVRMKASRISMSSIFAVRVHAIDQNTIVGLWLFDEGNGEIAQDSSENGNDGNVVSPNWVDGQFGEALELIGSGYVEVPASECLNSI